MLSIQQFQFASVVITRAASELIYCALYASNAHPVGRRRRYAFHLSVRLCVRRGGFPSTSLVNFFIILYSCRRDK